MPGNKLCEIGCTCEKHSRIGKKCPLNCTCYKHWNHQKTPIKLLEHLQSDKIRNYLSSLYKGVTWEERHGKGKADELKENMAKAVSASLKRRKKPTSIEITLVNNLINIYGPDIIEPQFPFEGYLIDCAVPTLKLAFEADGEYWHQIVSERDIERDKFLFSQGWEVIRLSEKTLNRWPCPELEFANWQGIESYFHKRPKCSKDCTCYKHKKCQEGCVCGRHANKHGPDGKFMVNGVCTANQIQKLREESGVNV